MAHGVVELHEYFVPRMRAEPSPIPDFIEVTLRYDRPIQCTFRRATADAALQGVPVSRGATVVPLWAAAGWNPAVFEQPALFDPTRANVRQHMGFGYGLHFCAGAELARLEARIVFETLLSRLSHIELDEASSDLGHLPSFAARGYRRVPQERAVCCLMVFPRRRSRFLSRVEC